MSFQLFDRIRAFLRSSNMFSHENILQNQTDISRMTVGNEIINYNSKGLVDQTNLQINRLERYKDYDQMDEMGEVSLSLDLYADEGTQLDTERKKSLLIKAKSKDVKEELEHLFYNVLSIESKLRPMMRYLCKYGDFATEIIPSVNRDAVSSIKPMNIYNFLRVETQYGDLVGFYFTDPMINASEPAFMHPWQVTHMRLTSYENIYAPYGKSILDGGRRDFRRLRLMEDAALIYRITRAPVKRIFTIPVGDIPSHQVPDFLNQISDQFKKHRFYDPATGEVNWRYAPLIQEDDFWMPARPDGTGPKVDTLPGAENLDQIADIVYFKKKMIAALKIPFSRVGLGDTEGIGSDKSLASTSSEFAKAVHWIQMEMATGLKKIALVHLAMAGFTIEQMNDFDLSLTASSAIDELYRIETWNSRVNVISGLKETGLFPDQWILEHFTDMTEDEIDQMQVEQANAAPAEEGEEMPDVGGLPGLGEASEYNTKLAKSVITEYKNAKKGKNAKSEDTQSGLFDHMLNSRELDGLPSPIHSKSNVIMEELEDSNGEYIIPPPNDEDSISAKEENKLLILAHYETPANTNALVVPVDGSPDEMARAVDQATQ